MEKKFKIKSRNLLDKMNVEDYINYYESALVAWNNKDITNEEIYNILDGFSERAYSMITFLMGCCNLSSVTFHHIETNLLALRLELESLLNKGKSKDKAVLKEDIYRCIEDINDLCEISIKGLSGSFRKEGESILKEIDLTEATELQNAAMENYISDSVFSDSVFSDIEDDLNILTNKEGDNYDAKQFQQQYLGIFVDSNSDDCVANLDDGQSSDRIDNNKLDLGDKFYCRIIDQNTGIDKEFKNLNDVKKFIGRL